MELVTIKEVSKFLKVKESTLYSWVHNGSIPSYKLNGLLRFELDEVREWVKNSKPISNKVLISHKKSKDSDLNGLIKRAIDDVTGKRYNPSKRESNLNQGLRKEIKDGTV